MPHVSPHAQNNTHEAHSMHDAAQPFQVSIGEVDSGTKTKTGRESSASDSKALQEFGAEIGKLGWAVQGSSGNLAVGSAGGEDAPAHYIWTQ